MKTERENNHIDPENENVKPEGLKQIAPFISLYNEVIGEQPDTFDPEKSKAAIALAVMTDNPENLRHLSDLWQTPHEQLLVSIRDSYYDSQIKQVGFEIFDRKKAQDEAKKPKSISVAERVEQLFANLPPDLLTEHQQLVVEYVNAGMTNEQIGSLLGIKKQSVAVILVQIREKIDPLVKEAGLMKLSSFHNAALKSAARHGTLDAEKILRMYHTTSENAKRYIKKERIIDQELLDVGYILLTDRSQVSEAEYHTLLGKKHKSDIVRKNNRAYISQEYLEKFKTQKIKRKSYQKPPPGQKLLIDCIPLPPDHPDRGYIYRMMLYRIKKGWISSNQIQRRWFVVEEDVLPEINALMEKKEAMRRS